MRPWARTRSSRARSRRGICGDAQRWWATGQDIGGEEGLISFAQQLQERLGGGVRLLFLIGFFSAAATSLLGVWNGVSLLFADFVRVARGVPDADADRYTGDTSTAFRWYLAWLTFPPMALLFSISPWCWCWSTPRSARSSCPYLAVTLLWLLNRRVDAPYRNGWLSNGRWVRAPCCSWSSR